MGVKVTKDRAADLLAAIKALTSREVLVGIPQINDARDDGEIGNAARAYIHEFGAPEANIPARPFLIPGVESVNAGIVDRMKRAAEAALDGKIGEVEKGLVAVGVMTATAVRGKILSGPFAPLKEATKAARLRRKAAYKRASEKQRRKMMAAYLAGDFSPLIDTGAMKDAITYVVADKKGKGK